MKKMKKMKKKKKQIFGYLYQRRSRLDLELHNSVYLSTEVCRTRDPSI